MNFDPAFRLPAWARELGMGPEQLVAWIQGEEGAAGRQVDGAALALAKWLLDNPERAEIEAGKDTSPLYMGGSIRRILAGLVLPSEAMAAAIEQMTGGSARFAAFFMGPFAAARAVNRGELSASEARKGLGLAPIATPAPAPDPEPAPSLLGETPGGPLLRVERCPRGVVVDGCGSQQRYSLAAAELLRDRLCALLPPKQSEQR